MFSRYALALPGQGVVRSGLLAPYKKYKPLYSHLLQQVDEALQFPLSEKLEDESGNASEWLRKTSNSQPAILATTYILHTILKDEYGVDLAGNSQYVMGHSLGEYSGLVLAGAFDLAAGVKIVRKRGQLMEQALGVTDSPDSGSQLPVPDVTYSSVALIINNSDNFAKVLQNARTLEILANHNSDSQLVISGETSILEQFVSTMNRSKRVISRAVTLPVTVPFHSRMLSQIEPELTAYINTFPQEQLRVPIISNLTAEPVIDTKQAISNSISSSHKPVLWAQSVEYVRADGVPTIVCLGPGKVLDGLLRKVDIFSVPIDTPDTFGSIASLTSRTPSQ